jgi:hypothetical protein
VGLIRWCRAGTNAGVGVRGCHGEGALRHRSPLACHQSSASVSAELLGALVPARRRLGSGWTLCRPGRASSWGSNLPASAIGALGQPGVGGGLVEQAARKTSHRLK